MNEQNLVPFTSDQSHEEAVTNGRKGGIASGEARRQRRTIADLLRAELEKDGGGGLTKQQYLVAKCLDNHARGKMTLKDLSEMQKILGEQVENINHTGNGVLIVTSSDAQDAIRKAQAGEDAGD